ncbi:MAG: (2Fe-2S) ferredoxin domain-containing protein [Candidatus Goldiibacteriota bacterium]
MSRLKKEELDKLRKTLKEKFDGEIIISMGTCGIASGGDAIYDFFKKELLDRGLDEINLKQTGCLGMCFCEPNLIIKIDGMPEVLYGYVNEETAAKIISEHILKKNILNENVVFMPSADIINPQEGR